MGTEQREMEEVSACWLNESKVSSAILGGFLAWKHIGKISVSSLGLCTIRNVVGVHLV